jgi:hypothetical protein
MKPVRTQIGGLGNLMFKEAYIYGQMKKNQIPDIYVQGEKYWKDFSQEVKQRFSEGIGHTDMVSLHLRRGDYMNVQHFYVSLWNTNYYQKAVEYFPKDKFLVFCFDRQDLEQDKEDREWTVKFLDQFIPGRYELWEPQSETEDLNKMASCKSNIMANSSFSWWGAFLNPNPNKKVICPAQWFRDGVERCELLDSWIKI